MLPIRGSRVIPTFVIRSGLPDMSPAAAPRISQHVTVSWSWSDQQAGMVAWNFVNSDTASNHAVVLYRGYAGAPVSSYYLYGGAFWPVYIEGPFNGILNGNLPVPALGKAYDDAEQIGLLDFGLSASPRYLAAFIFNIAAGQAYSAHEGGFAGGAPSPGICYALVDQAVSTYIVGYDPARVIEYDQATSIPQPGYSPNPSAFLTYAFQPEPGTPANTLGFTDSIRGPGWQPWFPLPPVSVPPGAPVTGLWRSSDTHLDLFATGTDGQVWSTWWEDGSWQSWFPLPPVRVLPPGAPVTGLWRSSGTHLDLFATGTDGQVRSTSWEPSNWQQWFPLPPVKVPPGAPVTGLWRSNSTHLDLFATGTDRQVRSTWWEPSNWQQWSPLPPVPAGVPPGAPVTGLWRSSDTHLDLFATGTDGQVRSTWWEPSSWQQWFLLPPVPVGLPPGAPVTGLWHILGIHLDLFATGTDGQVWSTWWDADGWHPWFALAPAALPPGAPVTGLWRSAGTHLDLFATGTDGQVWSTWWQAEL